MNPEIKQRWVAALRSDKYKQGIGKLRHKDDTFCCLGVLCDLAAQAGIGVWEFTENGTHFVTELQRVEGSLPHAVVLWAGVGSATPSVRTAGTSCALPLLNDHGTSFSEIANLIEESL